MFNLYPHIYTCILKPLTLISLLLIFSFQCGVMIKKKIISFVEYEHLMVSSVLNYNLNKICLFEPNFNYVQ